jgi:hypothetical protein
LEDPGDRLDIQKPVMADEGPGEKGQPPLVDRILQVGKQAFDPEISWETRKSNVPAFAALLDRFVTVSHSETIY